MKGPSRKLIWYKPLEGAREKRASFKVNAAIPRWNERRTVILWQTTRGRWVVQDVDSNETPQEINRLQAVTWLTVNNFDLDEIYLQDYSDRLHLTLGMKTKTQIMHAARAERQTIKQFAYQAVIERMHEVNLRELRRDYRWQDRADETDRAQKPRPYLLRFFDWLMGN